MSEDPEAARRKARGLRAHLAGAVAEAQVARHYAAQGFVCRETRWRGAYGEIDLVLEGPLPEGGGCGGASDGACLVFVEVKRARSFADAAPRLGAAQTRRIGRAALDYVARHPECQQKRLRFDLALVDGTGEIRLVADAFRFDGWL
ncbi:YraN family protein [Thioclava sp. GXIMD4215]|uniref:YraN family protein n=1 Tax=Thioclava sp. GXIMD4215 TaxID=3131928 RepID=UPI0032451611